MTEGEHSGELVAEDVRVAYAGVVALDGMRIRLPRDTVVGLIGPNGAGKTTLVNVLSGFQSPDAGRVTLDGADITRAAPYRRARLGMSRTFQGGRLFLTLSVLENVAVAGLAVGLRARAAERTAWELLELTGLAEAAHVTAGALPYGDQRLLGLARSLAGEPSFLLLDEPAAGLNEVETDGLLEAIEQIREQRGCGILVVEHDMRLIMQACRNIHVIDQGRTLFVGNPEQVQRDESVIDAYLGRPANA